MTARTSAMEASYQKARKDNDLVPLVDEPAVKDYHCWKLVKNRFPHDKLNSDHYLLVLKRPCEPYRISMHELEEMWKEILPELDKQFHYMKFNFGSLRSINNYVHLHICNHLPEYV